MKIAHRMMDAAGILIKKYYVIQSILAFNIQGDIEANRIEMDVAAKKIFVYNTKNVELFV